MASSYGFTKFFVATLCLVGFCKITFKLDSYMAALGVNLGRPSPGMGALGAAMAAQRIFSQAGRAFSLNGWKWKWYWKIYEHGKYRPQMAFLPAEAM